MHAPTPFVTSPAHRWLAWCVACLVVVLAPCTARGQDNPTYVDDSPRAWELFQLAQDQASGNLGEAVRLYQELLDEYALKLMQAGVPTELHSFPGTFHGSALFTHTQVAKREAAEMFAVLSRALGVDN